jgi:hypothetical protein
MFVVSRPEIASLARLSRAPHAFDGVRLAWGLDPAWWDDADALLECIRDLDLFKERLLQRAFCLGARPVPSENGFWDHAHAEMYQKLGIRVSLLLIAFFCAPAIC